MGKRGPKPKGKVKIEWSSDFAYAVGLLVTDGCLSPDGRHIVFVSADIEQLHNFQTALQVNVEISSTRSGYDGRQTTRIQFSDVRFYEFLLSLGLTPNKSKTIGKISVPKELFFDFLRGCYDGDGCLYSYWDPRWKSSYMFYLVLASASKKFIDWVRLELEKRTGVHGHISRDGRKSTYQLKYAKRESLKIIKNMYYSESVLCLTRKKQKIFKAIEEAGIDKQMPRW